MFDLLVFLLCSGVLLLLLGVTGVVGDDLLAPILDLLTGVSGAPPTMVLRLYTNNRTPAVTDTVASYNEATFTGYAPVTLSGWSAAAVAAHVGSTAAANATFTITAGSQVIYGVFLTNVAGTAFYGAIRDPGAPVTIDVLGINNYVVSMSLSDQSV